MMYVITYSYDGIPKITKSANYDDMEKFRKHLVAAANEGLITIDYIRFEKIELLYDYSVNPLYERLCKGLHFEK